MRSSLSFDENSRFPWRSYFGLFPFIRLLGIGHQALALENLALLAQLAAFRRKRNRPAVTPLDRWFWAALSQVWRGWWGALVFVQTDTVCAVAARAIPKILGAALATQARRKGRSPIAAEIRRLVLRIAAANPLWRSPRIHGELKMLGIAEVDRLKCRFLSI
jgi:hypothetical protein